MWSYVSAECTLNWLQSQSSKSCRFQLSPLRASCGPRVEGPIFPDPCPPGRPDPLGSPRPNLSDRPQTSPSAAWSVRSATHPWLQVKSIETSGKWEVCFEQFPQNGSNGSLGVWGDMKEKRDLAVLSWKEACELVPLETWLVPLSCSSLSRNGHKTQILACGCWTLPSFVLSSSQPSPQALAKKTKRRWIQLRPDLAWQRSSISTVENASVQNQTALQKCRSNKMSERPKHHDLTSNLCFL